MILSNTLAQLEKRLQKLVEDSLDGIFTATDLQKTLSHELLVALQREARPTGDGRVLAPDRFTIFLPPATAQRLAAYHNRVDELTRGLEEAIQDYAQQANYLFAAQVSIRILTDQAANSPHTSQPSVVAAFSLQDTTQTATLGIAARLPENPPAASSAPQTTRAFLIVNGIDIFPLPGRQAGGVINIGRMAGNQLTLENNRVSRTHAQLRILQGRYMLFDLASTHGTFVNGLRINQHELKAGDVISFGGVPVVFGLEETTNPSFGLPGTKPEES